MEKSSTAQRFQEGDMQAFESLYREFAGNVFGLVMKLTRDADWSNDLVHDVFVKAFEARKSFNPSFPFLPWICRIAYNHTLNRLKVEKRTELLYADVEGETTTQQSDWDQFNDSLQEALQRLGSDAQSLFIMRNKMNMKVKEIAKILEVNEGTVKSRLFYLNKTLADQLAGFKHLYHG